MERRRTSDGRENWEKKLRKQKDGSGGLGSIPLFMLAVSRPDIKASPKERKKKVLENMKNRRWPQSKHTQAQTYKHTHTHTPHTQSGEIDSMS